MVEVGGWRLGPVRMQSNAVRTVMGVTLQILLSVASRVRCLVCASHASGSHEALPYGARGVGRAPTPVRRAYTERSSGELAQSKRSGRGANRCGCTGLQVCPVRCGVGHLGSPVVPGRAQDHGQPSWSPANRRHAESGWNRPGGFASEQRASATEYAPRATHAAIVFDGQIFGAAVPHQFHESCVRLAALVGVPLLQLVFEASPAQWRFVAATGVADFRVGGEPLVRALHATLVNAA